MPNADIMQQALEIARAQAGVRPMTAAEVAAYVNELAAALESTICPDDTKAIPAVDPKNSIGESYVTCLECGKKFKVMGNRHLKLHGLTSKEYKAKWGLKKSTSLAAKSLVRMRRRKMQEMRLWERKKLAGE
ncbi:MAG TPA: MucR family transcriptional regulator [Candidatus Desulfovibrio intestinipullorum]|uniref:MucR family transcriptional regulator n=1 Tax=Candidatus Desulfovibrio intestinipullorum TaxID=2838536 RepID=A0A9D1TNS3_9BACT|nr:MucR family transcriptional regulator [Candidatus Desulfovibrio intestinipullorum]